jgi:hypothetical protein
MVFGAKIALSLLCWLSLALGTWAEPFQNDLNMWLPVTLEGPVKGKLSWHLETQTRLDNRLREFNMVLVRPSLIWEINPKWGVRWGYLWAAFKPEDMVAFENQVWQQLHTRRNWGKTQFTSHVRLEQRFFTNEPGVNVRSRFLVGVVHPMNDQWSWVGSNEVFFNLNEGGGEVPGFDQNRFYTGLRRRLSECCNTEAGYMARLRPNSLDHIIMLRLSITFDKDGS